MHAYDIDGDGDQDVVSSMRAHAYGLSWFENIPVNGVPKYVEHVILTNVAANPGKVQFSQLHALAVADIDGDGLLDVITGKTAWAHNGKDPGASDPAVVYWFRLKRSGGKVRFEPQFAATKTGIGRQFCVTDVTGDGKVDIVIGNKLGAAVLVQQ